MIKELAKKIYYSERITRVRTNVSHLRTSQDRQILVDSQLLSNSYSLKSSLMSEVCSFFNISKEEVLKRIEDKDTIKKSWYSKERLSKARVEEFYDDESFVFGDLLRAKLNGMGFLGLRKVVGSLELALKLKDDIGNEYLDYGCGLGVCPVLFANYDFNISVADISSLLIEFTSYRLTNRKVSFQKYNLKHDILPKNHYSFVTCFDVLEHAFNPLEVVRKIRNALKPRGVVCIFFAYGITKDNPTHIVGSRSCIDEIRKLGFQELEKERNRIMRDGNNLFVFQKAHLD